MTEHERESRLKFLGLTEQDSARLRELRPLFVKEVPTVVDLFYAHLTTFPDTAQLLRDRTTIDRLTKLQCDYLLLITEGRFDAIYFEDRLRIGRTHDRVGLSPRWYLAGFSLYFRLLATLIYQHYADQPEQAHAAIIALEKVFMLDASLAMEAYIASDRYRHLRQLESIVNDSADVIFMLDNEKVIRAWNRAAERIFGWPAAEIIGKHISIMMPADLVASGELETIDETLTERGFCHFETERMARDGHHVPVELTVSALHDPQGNTIGRSVILRDITERNRLLEAKVQSERLATIGAMSAKLAHEIRNPLSSITLNIDLVGDEIEALSRQNPAAGEEARSLLKSINSEVRRITRVAEDYLKFARLPKLHRERVSLNTVLTEGLSFLGSLFSATEVKVRTETDPALPPILADEGQLWQAVLNLVRNSIEAMPEGGSLTVRTTREGDQVVLSIADTGPGIAVERQEKLFKPFFSTKIGGTGLGLPLTQQIIAEHGGTIECVSSPAAGTTFIIRLPIEGETLHGQTR